MRTLTHLHLCWCARLCICQPTQQREAVDSLSDLCHNAYASRQAGRQAGSVRMEYRQTTRTGLRWSSTVHEYRNVERKGRRSTTAHHRGLHGDADDRQHRACHIFVRKRRVRLLGQAPALCIQPGKNNVCDTKVIRTDTLAASPEVSSNNSKMRKWVCGGYDLYTYQDVLKPDARQHHGERTIKPVAGLVRIQHERHRAH